MESHYQQSSVPPFSISLEELFGEIMYSSLITDRDYQRLLKALEQDILSEDETAIIRRLLYNIRRGWIRQIEDSSPISNSQKQLFSIE